MALQSLQEIIWFSKIRCYGLYIYYWKSLLQFSSLLLISKWSQRCFWRYSINKQNLPYFCTFIDLRISRNNLSIYKRQDRRNSRFSNNFLIIIYFNILYLNTCRCRLSNIGIIYWQLRMWKKKIKFTIMVRPLNME